MKKRRILVLSVIMMVMLMGAGYAAWTDRLTITTTAGTGELNVDFTNACFLPLLVGTDCTNRHYMELAEPTISSDKKTLTVSIKNMYPKTLALLATRFDNNGTIPAEIKDVEVKFTTKNELLEQNLKVAGGYILFDKANKPKENGSGIFKGTLGELQTKLTNMLNDVRMEEGDYILFDIPEDKAMRDEIKEFIPLYENNDDNCILFYLPCDAGNELKEQTAVFEIKINFKQHNQ